MVPDRIVTTSAGGKQGSAPAGTMTCPLAAL